MRMRALTLLLLACSALSASGPRAETGVRPLVTEDEAINRRPLKLPVTEPKIVVEKGARRLTLYSGGERVRVFPVALGFEPAGDKVKQGDGRTPEGEFYVCMKNER